MNYYQEPLTNKKPKSISVSDGDAALFNFNSNKNNKFIYDINHITKFPILISNTEADTVLDDTFTCLSDDSDMMIYNIPGPDLHPTRKFLLTNEEFNILDATNQLDFYLTMNITETESILFYDNQNQWIVDDNFRQENDHYLFEYLNIIADYEYINITEPTEEDMEPLSKYSTELYPDIVRIKSFELGIVDSLDEYKDMDILYIPTTVYIYDALLHDTSTSNLTRFITKEMFIMQLADIDNNMETGTPFSEVISDIKDLIIETLYSVEMFINLYGFHYRLYDDVNDVLFTTEQQPVNDKQYYQFSVPALTTFIPNGCDRTDILSTKKAINALDPVNITVNDNYVTMKLFDNDIKTLDILDKELLLLEKSNTTIKFDNLHIEQNFLPTELIVLK